MQTRMDHFLPAIEPMPHPARLIAVLFWFAAVGALGRSACGQVVSGQVKARPVQAFEIRPVNFDDQGADVIKNAAESEGAGPPGLSLPLQEDQPPLPLDNAGMDNDGFDQADVASIIQSHWYLHHRGGDQFGQPTPYTTLGYFRPINLENGILFGQAQMLIDNDGETGGGLSLGRRWFLPERNRVVSTAISFDATPTPFQNTATQFVLSAQTLGDKWDASVNGYLPTGPRTRLSGSPTPGGLQFVGNSLVLDLMDQAETSMSGVDIEIARRLGDQNLWAFGGWYQFQGAGERIDGGMFGLRGYLYDSLAVSLNVSDDPVFGSNVGFSATYFFGGGSGGMVAPGDVSTRMAEPIYRREIVTRRETTVLAGTQTLTNAGNPITFAHVNDAGPGGTGQFNNPYGTLNDAAGDPADIVLVHANTVFNGEQFTVAAGQKFLGESAIPQVVATDQLGLVALPSATGGLNAPVIMNSPGDAITLGSGSTVSQFNIQSAGGVGVFGQDVGNVLIENVAVQGAAGAGLQLQVTGVNVVNATVRNNVFTGNGAQSGFLFGANAGAILNAHITGNEDSLGFQLQRDANGFLRLAGSLGLGGFFNDDNGNIANEGNTTGGGAPVVNILGAGNQIEIINPGSIPAP